MNWVGMRSNLKRGWPRDQRRSYANELSPYVFAKSEGGGIWDKGETSID